MHFKAKITIEHLPRGDRSLVAEMDTFAEFVRALRTVAEHSPYMVEATTAYEYDADADYSDAEQYRRPKDAS